MAPSRLILVTDGDAGIEVEAVGFLAWGWGVVPDRLVVDLGGDGQAGVLSWPEGGLPEEVSRAPFTWPLDGEALEDLRWYLEDYLLAPFGVWEDRGPAVRGRLAGWGDQVFGSVFGGGPARFAYERARDRGLEVVFRSADPGLLGLPWELMRDGAGPVAQGAGGISRSLPTAGGARMLEVPGGRLRVLMVISRPRGTRDVGYQMVARPLLERLEAVCGEVDLTVLRPPTFDALASTVQRAAEAGEPFHVVHFDGHGAMPGRSAGGGPPGGRPAMMTGPGEGVLAFEQPGGGSDHAGASQVAAVLAEGKVPVVVLNACQSGAVSNELEASVATALLSAGCAAVVAMAYSVYAVAAAEFMAAFYETLFTGASVGQAVGAGRKRLSGHDRRPSPRGDMPLADWLVPVHYMRGEVRFPQARTSRPAAAPSLDAALDQIRAAPSGPAAAQDPLAALGVFVGRDDLFYQLEAAAREQRVVVLGGLGGTGKTELAKGFARWWRDTGGVDDPRLVCWHSFEPGVASFGLDGVITALGLAVVGADFARLDPPQRLGAVKQLLAQHRALLVWDNFESVREMPDPAGATPPLDEADCTRLRDFLEWVRDHSSSTVIITSRASEGWLGQVRRIDVSGLNRAEAVEYAGYLLAPFPAARERRERPSFGELLQWLDGHPLAMRLTLPRLDATDAGDLLAALRGATPLRDTGDDHSGDRSESLSVSIAYSFAHLAPRTWRLLPAVCLFQGVAHIGVLAIFSTEPDVPGRFASASDQDWQEVLDEAGRVGLLTPLGAGMYRVHPALPGYLAALWRAEDPDGYDSARDAATRALVTACAALGTWLYEQLTSRDAGSAQMITGLLRRTFGTLLGYAVEHRLWEQAQAIVQPLSAYWDARGLDEEAADWTDRILATLKEPDGSPPSLNSTAGGLWLFIIGAEASRHQVAMRLGEAELTNAQILAMLQAQPASLQQRNHIASASYNLGIIAQAKGQLADAEDWYRKALAIKEELGNRPGMADSYHQLGRLAQDRGQLADAEDWYRKALAIREDLGDRPMADSYHQLGWHAQLQGRLVDAEDWYRRALAIDEGLGDRPGMAACYHHLGMAVHLQGRLADAEDWYRRALAIYEEAGDRPRLAYNYHQLGILAQDRGRLADAEDWYRKSLAISEDLGNRPLMALTLAQFGLLSSERGQPGQALELAVRSVTVFGEFPHPSTGTAPRDLARLVAHLGMGALEACWQKVTGSPLPQAVRDYITSHRDEEPGGEP